MAKVFIGMPVYNGERYLQEALDSLLNQSFTDFTVFISDDTSSDSTPVLCKEYAARDPRVIYYRQPENLGMFGNFKFVLDQADAEYFIWMAQDDVRERDYLQTCVAELDADNTLGLATTTVQIIDSFGRVIAEESEVAALTGNPSPLAVTKYTLLHEGLGKANLMYGLWRTSAARVVWDAYPQRGVWAQDYHVVLALITRFGVYVHKTSLFKKRVGGFSSAELALTDKLPIKPLSYKDRNNGIPFKNFQKYFAGQMEASRGTKYQTLVALSLYLRLPGIFAAYIKERNYRKFFRRIFGL